MVAGPIFIGGLSFSGKTQLRLRLSAHPNIVITRKTYMWTRFYGRFGDLSLPENFEHCLEAMLRFKHMKILHPDPERIRREFWQGPATYARLFKLFHQHFAERMGKPRWGDQLGSVEQYVDLIFDAYPSAKMIHMIRDPRHRLEASLSAAASYRKGKVGWETAQWRYSAQLALRNQRRYSDRYKVVRFEKLFSATEETLEDICSFLEEEFSPMMLAMEGTLRLGKEPGENGAARDGSKRLTGFSNEPNHSPITLRERMFIRTFTKREMLALGYSLEPIGLTSMARLEYLLVDWPINLAGLIGWYVWGDRRKG